MKKRMVLLCNTCPFDGENFLLTELDLIPNDCNITLFPIFIKNIDHVNPKLNRNIEVIQVASTPISFDRMQGVVNSIVALFQKKEISAALKRIQPLRNILKAIKFAYLAERRAHTIARWLKENHQGEEFVFYSYWMYETAYVAARLNEMFSDSIFVTRCHGYDLYEERHANGYIPYRNYIVSSAYKIYPISNDGRDYLKKQYGEGWGNKIDIMRLGTIDSGECSAQKGDGITLASCSNLVEIKRVDKIIDALSLCKDNIIWYHIGDGPLKNELESKARQLPTNIEWHFLGFIPNTHVIQFYQENYVDAFLNVSESEGVPVSVMEALSFGIPVIATDVGGTHEIVINHENGILLEKNFQSQQLVNAIIEVTSRECLRSKSREVWLEKCSAITNYENFYQEIKTLGE